jgi:ATP-dependent Lon protease
MDINIYRVAANELKPEINDEWLDFKTTAEVEPCKEILGQERAVKALKLGLEIESPGYNVFVTGILGTGRKTTIKLLLEEIVKTKKVPDDLLFVNNFEHPDTPLLITLPPGQGKVFAQAMNELIEFLVKTVPGVFESDLYLEKKNKIIGEFKEKSEKLADEFEAEIKKDGFRLLVASPTGRPELVYFYDGQAYDLLGLQALYEAEKITKENFTSIREKYLIYLEELRKLFKKIREFEKEAQKALLNLNEKTLSPIVEERINELKDTFPYPKVERYLEMVKNALLKNVEHFLRIPQKEEKPESSQASLSPEYDPFLEFRVNIVVDNSIRTTAPVIFENNPTWKNLLGTIERTLDRRGQWRTDFTKIKAGSLLRANGGFLILNALDVLLEPNCWNILKRTLRTQLLEISATETLSIFPLTSLKPEPIPLDLKVILIGDFNIYSLLYNYDPDFQKIFKVRADFDWEIPLNQNNLKEYIGVIKAISDKENLMDFDRDALKRVVEYALKLSGRKNRLSTQFTKIADLLREANYWAQKEDQRIVLAVHVKKALAEQEERVKLVEEKIIQMINEGILFIDTEGMAVGQVNGLSLLNLGDYIFGRPSRITAKIGVGSRGLINIEREAELSGPIHNKGVYIISGYLTHRYAQNKPLILNASICFEQSYSGIEGDSASSAELYALLSSLADLPLRQDLAVTGSVNQKGEIQPIGGVNEKIEGFYRVCKVKGFTGTQGVIIPTANLNDFVLSDEIIEMVQQNKFHIYAVKNIDEGIEILTGIPAGAKDQNGNYPEGTVNFLVDKRLKELAEIFRTFRSPDGN